MARNCTYEITINGEKKVFNSEMELDTFLDNYAQNMVVDNVDATLQVDQQQVTVDKISEAIKKYKSLATEFEITNEDGEKEIALKLDKSMGVTKFLTTYGDPFDLAKVLVTKFNLEEYLKREKERLMKKGMTSNEADKYLEDLQKSWTQLTDYGTEVHKLFESVINPEIEYTPKLLNEEQVSLLQNQLRDFIEDTKEKFGRDCKFITEIPIVSEDIAEPYKAAGLNSINGRIDLLIVDKNGNAHIRDFKVSRKAVGAWDETRNALLNNVWASTKKLGAAYQLNFYKAMLEQQGINVATVGIIPVKLDIDYKKDNSGNDNLSQIDNLSSVYIDSDNIIVNPSNTIGKYYDRVREIIPIRRLTDSFDIIKTIEEPMSKFFPNYELSSKVQRKNANFKFYKEKIVQYISSSAPEAGYGKYRFWNEYKPKDSVKSRWEYAQTEEELDKKLEDYIKSINERRGNELADIAQDIINVQQGSMDINDIAKDNPYKGDFLRRHIEKYIEGEWQFENNPSFISAGLLVFTKNKVLEIVSITNNVTHQTVKLEKGTNILGSTIANRDVDEHKIMSATNGNIDLIKVMALLNSDAIKYENYRINKIESINIWQQTGSEQYFDKLYDNFVELCRIHNVPINLKRSNFSSTLESVVSTITDICGPEKLKHIGNWAVTFSADDVIKGGEFLKNRMEELRKLDNAQGLRKAIHTGQWNFDDPLQTSYMLLGKALNKVRGYEVYIEPDPAKWVSVTGSFHAGTNITSINNSPSLTAQEVGRIVAVTETKIRRQELAWDSKIRKVFKEFYKFKDQNRLIGGEVKYFDNLFRRDENGNITKDFMLKDINDSSLAKEEKALIKTFTEIVNQLRFEGNPGRYQQAIEDGTYYQVPVTIGSMKSQFHNKGFKEGLKMEYQKVTNMLRLFEEQMKDFDLAKDAQRVYNKFKIGNDTREQIISNHGINSLETQLEDLLRSYIHAYVAEAEYNDIIPQIQGIKIALQYNQAMYGQEAENLLEFLDKYLTVNIYNKPIMDKGLQPVYKTLAAIKKFTTATALGLNLRSGLREMMQGMWIHISRAMTNAYGKDQFSGKDLAEAWGIIFKDSPKRIATLTKVEALNADFGMANMDADIVQKELSQSRNGIKNFNSDMLYVCNRAPDVYHRMGLLIAKMIHDGCWEAYSLNSDDELVYDFKKDKRFNVFTAAGADVNSEAYKRQEGLYEAYRQQFNQEGWNIEKGQPLPRAYTVREATSIKSFTELCFGHYDKNTQMLAKSMFMGAMMLQFRTFLSAKLEQWILKPGTYNQGKFVEKFDENGVRYVMIQSTGENGLPTTRVDLETNVKEGETATPYVEWQGRFIEGIAYSMIDFLKAIGKMDYNEFKALWANPTKKANFYLFLTDLIFMSLIMWMIYAVFLSEENKEELGALGHLGAMALYTSFQDGPIQNIVAQFAGDLNPPAYSIIKNIVNQSTAVITGDKNLWEGATSTFGFMSDLKYIGDKLD